MAKALITAGTQGKATAAVLTAAGKPSVEAAPELVKPIAQSLAPASAALDASVGNLVLFGGFGVVSAVTNQVEYLHERADVRDFYREELAAKGGKEPAKVVSADLDEAEKSNGTIKQEMGRQRAIRNLGIAASFVASVAVYVLMKAIAPELHLEWSVPFAAKVAASVICYIGIKAPLMKAGEKLFGLNKETTHELILNISKDREHGKSITREQVVEVMISGNKHLGEYVVRTFGKEYEHLPLADKVRVATEIAQILPVDKIANNINLGTTSASELAYTVEGDVSGVLPKPIGSKDEPSRWESFKHHCKQMMHSVGGMFRSEKAHPIPEIERKAKSEPAEPFAREEESPVVEFNRGKSFVEKIGRGQHDASKDHVSQLAERSAQQVVMPGSPTIN